MIKRRGKNCEGVSCLERETKGKRKTREEGGGSEGPESGVTGINYPYTLNIRRRRRRRRRRNRKKETWEAFNRPRFLPFVLTRDLCFVSFCWFLFFSSLSVFLWGSIHCFDDGRRRMWFLPCSSTQVHKKGGGGRAGRFYFPSLILCGRIHLNLTCSLKSSTLYSKFIL